MYSPGLRIHARPPVLWRKKAKCVSEGADDGEKETGVIGGVKKKKV